jgi:hypothetical protein
VEETLRDLAGLNGEEARKPYREALRDLIKALDWARDEALKEVDKILAELGIPEDYWYKKVGKMFAELGVPEDLREIVGSLLIFVSRRLAAVFKSGEVKRCWQRVAFIAGHALAGYLVVPTTKPPEDDEEALGDALKPCAVDGYLTIGVVTPSLSILVVWFLYYIKAIYARDLSQIWKIRERLGVLTPYVDAETIKSAKKTAEELLIRWREGGFLRSEAFYALGLAALAAGAEVDEKTADLLLHTASAAVRKVIHPAAVLPILAALRPLGEKAPHRYVVALAAASEPTTLNQETAQYIYDMLQQLKNRLLETGHIWPLVNAVLVYSNLLTKHSVYIKDRWEEAVVDICRLYNEVKKRGVAAASDHGFSAHHLFDATVRARVLAAALRSDDLAPLVQRYCGLGDLEKEVKEVMGVLGRATARLDELRKIMENDTDFAEWVTTRSPAGNAGFAVKNLRSWFTYELALYKLNHALNERGELDEEKLKEAAKEFENVAEIGRALGQWENYLASSNWALRARILAAKSWEELLKRAKGFQELWRETEGLEPTAEYLAKAAANLGKYIVYLAASGDRLRAEELLKEWRWLLNYDREVSVATRLMLKLFDVGEGAKLKEVVDAFEPQLSPEYLPALLMLAGRLQKDETLEECAKFIPPSSAGLYVVLRSIKTKAELCVDAVAAVANNQVATKILRSNIEMDVPKAHPLLEIADGKTLVEVLTPISSTARLVFILLAAVEGRADAVRLHGLWGSAAYKGTVLQPLFRAVHVNCGKLDSEECKMALLKLYYLHY